MAVQDRTSVFEMRQMVDHRHEQKLTPAKVDRFPQRDIDALTDALSRSGSAAQAAHRLDCQEQDVYTWADVYGLDVDALLVGGGADV